MSRCLRAFDLWNIGWDGSVVMYRRALLLLYAVVVLAGCSVTLQPGALPSPEEECANAGGTSSHGLCRYRGQ